MPANDLPIRVVPLSNPVLASPIAAMSRSYRAERDTPVGADHACERYVNSRCACKQPGACKSYRGYEPLIQRPSVSVTLL